MQDKQRAKPPGYTARYETALQTIPGFAPNSLGLTASVGIDPRNHFSQRVFIRGIALLAH